jgi:ABC-type molybdenum transport system ATPase subunit/photorepair protein PhrA
MIENLFKSLEKVSSNKKFIEEELKVWDEKKENNLKLLKNLEEARIIFQSASQITQNQLSERISSIVSSALAAVFPDPYTFVVDFVQRRNVTECDLLFERNGKTRHPLSSCGFGAADVASLALRVAYWKLDGEARKTLILDEPTRALSLEKQPLAGMMIQELSRMPGGLQFIIVTHHKALAESADKHFIVGQNDGVSNIQEIEKEQI